ncbi:putative membrane protein [Encephalitozoon romaleae SJ-2008]|uniref:Protein YIF1 n=1 Tax=Encephalitozoon romaleae (strain SJ-2008) TaxID=1178016 RepID=I7APJ4_ENCRO|nr:putative membrane protein [Encephalitozoon romaleae SJ-2008]AFN83774.1 putative membrane protein [Encephalitozoon romaleae SJ-2008]
MEIEIGKEAIRRSTEYANKGLGAVSLKSFRTYFDIDNTFVLKKLVLILFPFHNKEWVSEDEGMARPELYVPIMSFISYVLIRALRLGFEGMFSPEKLGIVFTRLFFLEAMCVLFTRVSGYFFDVTLSTLDVAAYSGYKYVIAVLLQINRMQYVRIIGGMYLYVSFFIFLSRSLKRRVMDRGAERMRRAYYLFGIVIVQEFIVFLLS